MFWNSAYSTVPTEFFVLSVHITLHVNVKVPQVVPNSSLVIQTILLARSTGTDSTDNTEEDTYSALSTQVE